jgi:glycosyltransferase involved in cell wall biosynthesis
VAPVATLVSFRLGGSDGVAVEARKWGAALGELGFEVRRLAGELVDARDGDIVLPGLALDHAPRAGAPEEIAAALEGSDLVVVENICSLPVNPAASSATAAALADHPGRVVLHHHDLPWQRTNFRSYEETFPPRLPGALHVTINHRSRRELEARGYEELDTIHNRFELDALTDAADPVAANRRAATRSELGFADDDVVLLQPSRAIPRKNVPGGVRCAAELQRALPDRRVRYWLSGPAEDEYGPTLERVLERSTVPTTVDRARTSFDAYAASDAVVFPSTWEGFGNPTIESIAACRPLAVYRYPVLGEITAYGLRYFDLDEAPALARFIRSPDQRLLDTNLRRARASFSIADLPAAIDAAFSGHGWLAW